MIRSHPEPQLLAEFAAGSLSFGVSLCLSTHLAHCDSCRRAVAALDEVGGTLLEELAPMPVGDGLFERVMQRIDETPVHTPPPPSTATAIPQPLVRLLPHGFGAAPWRRLAPGMEIAPLAVGEDRLDVSLIRIRPGGHIGRHTHRGEEFTVVLQGSFSDHSGVHQPGDFLACDESDTHDPLAARHEPCICLIAMEAPIRFTGPVRRLLNPFLKVQPR